MAVAIIADDLTGACDAAAPFAARGFETAVALAAAGAADSFVQAYDIDCRDRGHGVKEAVRDLAAATSDRAILLKIDSTLRGPIPAMVEGVLVGGGRRAALVAPAFPEQGRAIVHGRLVVDGVVDDAAPVLADALRRILSRVVPVEAPCPDASVLLALGSSGGESRPTADRELAGGRALAGGPAPAARPALVAIVIDAEDPSGLVPAADAWLYAPSEVVLVGSSGIARRAAAALRGPRRTRRARSLGTGPIALVAASPTAVSQRQLDRLQCLGLDSGSLAVFRTETADPGLPRDDGAMSVRVVDRFMAWLEHAARPRLVVLVGGRTARHACERLGATRLSLGGELAPGIPYGRFDDGALEDAPVITKAGGFGDDDALVAIVEAATDERTGWQWNSPAPEEG